MFDGYTICHIIIPTITWYSKNSSKLVDKYDNIYVTDGKIIYKDSEGIMQEISIESALDKSYMGKYVYIKIPSDISSNSNFKIRITLRDNRYDYSFN